MDEKVKVKGTVKVRLKKPLPSPIAIVGMGVTGQAVLELLLLLGYERSEIATFDQGPNARPDFNSSPDLLQSFKPKTLLVSPGVPLSTPWIQTFASTGGLISSELSLAYSFLNQEKIIAVTGSLGKSTTVSILGAGLSAFSPTGFTGGNLGLPLAAYIVDRIKGRAPADWLILELSSYQLENCAGLYADLSAITFFTPNHLERYSSLDSYYRQKWELAKLTKTALFLNLRGGDLKSSTLAAFPAPPPTLDLVWTSREDKSLPFSLSGCALLGEHNLDNLALAFKIAERAGWPPSAFAAMLKFPGLPHRLENLGQKNGVLYVNDSKATTMQSVRTAVESLRSGAKGRIHLLLGGKDKDLPWEELKVLLSFSPISFYFFGSCGPLAQKKSDLPGTIFKSLAEAFSAAHGQAQTGDLVLLSPGGTSLDEFKNFEDRGRHFRDLVNSHT